MLQAECLCSPQIHTLNPNPHSVMGLGGGPFGRCWGQESGARMSGIRALIQRLQRSLSLLLCEDTVRRQLSANQKVLTRHWICPCRALGLAASRPWEIIPIVYWPPNPWNTVRAARMDRDRPDTEPGTFTIMTAILWGGYSYYCHFICEKPEAQRG